MTTTKLSVALATVVALSTSAVAQSSRSREALPREPGWNQYLAFDLLDVPVYLANGKRVGDVEDLVLSPNGRISGVVLGVGGFLEVGERDVLVPYRNIVIGASNRTYGGRGAGQAGAARAPRSYQRWKEDETAFRNPRPTYGRIRPTHLVVVGLTRAELEDAPEWPYGAWRGAPAD